MVSIAADSAVLPETAAPRAELDPEREQALQETRARRSVGLGTRDFWASFALGASFLATAVLLATQLDSARTPHFALVAALVAAYAVLYRVEFEIGSGLAVQTQLAFVPMLFLLPLGFVPLAVAAGIMLGNVVEHLEGKISLERIFVRLANSWHAVGPVLVLAAAGEAVPALRQWPVYVAALGAQFAFDFAATAARERLALGVRPRLLIRYMSVAWIADCALSPIGLLAAIAAVDAPAAFVLVLPLAALLARSRASGAPGSTTRSSSPTPTAARHSCSATSSRPTTPTPACTARTSSRSRSPSPRSSASTPAAAATRSSSRCCTTSARSGSRTRSSTSPARSRPRSALIVETHTVIGEEMLDQVGGVLGNVGHLVQVVPRALRRRRLPRRARRRPDPARRADRLLLRRLQRDHDRPALPRGAVRRAAALRRTQFDPASSALERVAAAMRYVGRPIARGGSRPAPMSPVDVSPRSMRSACRGARAPSSSCIIVVETSSSISSQLGSARGSRRALSSSPSGLPLVQVEPDRSCSCDLMRADAGTRK